MTLPENHPLRFTLNDEVHARPPEELKAPVRLTYLALFTDWPQRDEDLQPIRELADRLGGPAPESGTKHYSENLGPFRLTWERHSEFTRIKVIVKGAEDAVFSAPALSLLTPEWVQTLPGRLLVATHVVLLPAGDEPVDHVALSQRFFDGNVLVGAGVAGGAATAFTDFRIADDGFSRILLFDRSLTPRQGGRTVQRLLEIDTYRIMALLALPVAQDLGPFLTRCEQDLAEITTTMAATGEKDEPALLDRLTQLEASVESRHADVVFRLNAAAAYYEIVLRRIQELREIRLEGLQTFREFTERRLSPAMQTCAAMAERQRALSARVAQATRLLSTRVAITTERQNQAVLESMNRRAKLQLRLQQTVEGLSVAAITYYIVSLVGYAANALSVIGLEADPKLIMAASIPVVVALTALGVRRIRRHVSPGAR